MNYRKSLAIVSFVALAPLSAYADGPSGDYWDATDRKDSATAPVADTRGEHGNYVEFTIDQLVAQSSTGDKTRAEVRKELAAMPMPQIGA